MLSLAKLASNDQRYYLEQADARIDHAGSVSSGAEDYYLGGPEAAGRWTGSASRQLGLRGEVTEAQLRAVLSQHDPRRGEKLAGPAAQARVPGFDLMFSVPKSASVLFGIGDERVQRAVVAAHEDAVAAGLRYLERHACRTRRGAGGHEVVPGSGFVAAAFRHRTSRAGDPQLHTHVLIANATRRADGLWGTLDGRQIYAHAKTAGYVHEAAFRRELGARLGVQWQPARNGIADIDGVSPVVIEAFSRRRTEIDAQVADWGRTSASARQSAALATRARKDYGVTPELLAGEWRQRARALGLDERALDDLVGHRPTRTRTFEDITDELLSPRGLTAQASTFDRRDVVRAFAARARAGASLDEIETATDALLRREEIVTLAAGAGEHVQRADVIRRADGRTVSAIAGAPRYSTVELLATEQRVIEDVLQRKGDGVAIADEAALDRALQARPTLGADQATMVRRLCRDGDGVQVVVGPPGTGKTFALDAAREAWQASGFVVSGAAVARQAARGLWDTAGIESTSVAALLSELRRGSEWGLSPRSVLIVDEAGMLGTRDLAELLTHATSARAKVVLVGDHLQLPEIDAGGAFRALVARTGPVRLTVNRRQHERHAREMLDLWRQSRVREAMTIAAEHGELVTSTSAEELHSRIVGDYCAAIMGGEDAVMITLRRADARELNRRARAWFDDAGRLGSDRVLLAGGEFATGDLVVLKLNDRRLGVENGNRGRVVAVDAAAGTVDVELSGDRGVTLPRDYLERRTARGGPTIVHGYAGTAHIAQGSTTGRAFVLGSDAAYREWGYVAWSRAREQTRFYICEPEADEHHAGVGQPRRAFEEVVRTMQHSRAQRAAVELVERVDRDRGCDARAATGRALIARRDPPPYIVAALGDRPPQPARAGTWDRAVEAIEGHRAAHEITDPDAALGRRPEDLLAHIAWRRARRALDDACRTLARSAAIELDRGRHERSL